MSKIFPDSLLDHKKKESPRNVSGSQSSSWSPPSRCWFYTWYILAVRSSYILSILPCWFFFPYTLHGRWVLEYFLSPQSISFIAYTSAVHGDMACPVSAQQIRSQSGWEDWCALAGRRAGCGPPVICRRDTTGKEAALQVRTPSQICVFSVYLWYLLQCIF